MDHCKHMHICAHTKNRTVLSWTSCALLLFKCTHKFSVFGVRPGVQWLCTCSICVARRFSNVCIISGRRKLIKPASNLLSCKCDHPCLNTVWNGVPLLFTAQAALYFLQHLIMTAWALTGAPATPCLFNFYCTSSSKQNYSFLHFKDFTHTTRH